MTLSSKLQYVHGLYYPSWRVYQEQPPSSMDCEKATHVLYAFALVNDNGELYHQDEFADLEKDVDGSRGCLQAITQLRSMHPHLNILISVGGGNGSECFRIFSASAEGRQRFAQSAADFVQKFGFDGIDIDWEHPSTPEQGRDYLMLLQCLRTQLPESLIASALPAGEWCLRNINMEAATDILDQIHLMCYDFAGSWSSQSGHQAQLFASTSQDLTDQLSGSAAVEYLISQNVAPEKIIVGIPVYGRSFLGVDGVGQPFTGSAGDQGVFEYKDLPTDHIEEFVDHEAVAAYCLGDDCGFVTYDTPATVERKAQYVKEQGLGGLFYWTGVADSDIESRSLITAGYRALRD